MHERLFVRFSGDVWLYFFLYAQLVSLRDIYRSSIDSSFKNSEHHRRLLRFILTDGYSEVKAIEYAPIPSITEEIPPGTKVC